MVENLTTYSANKTLLQKKAKFLPNAIGSKPEVGLVTSSDAKMSMYSVELPLSPHLSGSKGGLSSMNPSEMGIRHRDGIGQILMQL